MAFTGVAVSYGSQNYLSTSGNLDLHTLNVCEGVLLGSRRFSLFLDDMKMKLVSSRQSNSEFDYCYYSKTDQK